MSLHDSSANDLSHAHLKFSDIENLIDALILSSSNADEEVRLKGVNLEELALVKSEISTLKASLQEQDGKTDTIDILPLAKQDLDDVYKILEKSTNDILDGTDEILKIVNSTNPSLDIIANTALNISQKCNFQDLTGQRIKRVIKHLTQLERTMFALINVLIGSDAFAKMLEGKKLEYNNRNLMSGPQKLEEAPKQEEIDKLFS